MFFERDLGRVAAVLCAITVTTTQAQSSETPVPGQAEFVRGRDCLLYGKFLYKDTSCWLAHHVPSPPRAAAEDSVCHVTSGLQRGFYHCRQGVWRVRDPKKQPLKRAKRGWWGGSPPPPPPPPPPPNQQPSFTSCPASITETAPANQRAAVVTWSVSATDPESTPTVTQNQGPPPGSSFPEGDTTIGYIATDSGGLTTSCVFSVTVTVIRCSNVQELSHFAHGSQSCTGVEKNIHGSVCQHGCDLGHVLQGQGEVTCQSSGSWSSSFPSCQPVSCGAPGTVAGGHVVCPQGHEFEDTCTVLCDPGYQNFGVTSATCESSGTWSSQFADCTDTEAPKLPNGCPLPQQLYSGPLESPVTVTWADPVATDNSNQSPTLTSDIAKGSSLGVGVHTVTLTATDEAGNEETCHFDITIEARQCPALQAPDHSQVNCTRDTVEGSECTVTCNLGYRREGTATLLCLDTEKWDNSPPTCQAILCEPPSIPHGSFSCPLGYQHPSQCTLTCGEEGFQVQTPLQIQCLENATWSQFGSCQDVQPPEFPYGCPDNIELYAPPLKYDSVAHWSDPVVTDNSGDVAAPTSDVMSGASFAAGTTLVTYEATDEAGNTGSCQFSVTVRVLECPDPASAFSEDKDMTANVYACDDGHVYGAVCHVSCAPNHALVGESALRCDRDNGTHPPTVSWRWEEGESGKPVCREDKCPEPPTPKNGAVACHLGVLGKECTLSCQASWELHHNFGGFLYCLNSVGVWYPNMAAVVLGCVRRRLPHRQIMKTSMLYTAEDCTTSKEELRHSFITRIEESIFRDACVHVPSCTAENVEVTCGPIWPTLSGRSRRRAGEARSWEEKTLISRATRRGALRRLRSAHYYVVTFEVHVPYVEDEMSPEETYMRYTLNQKLLRQRLLADVKQGKMDVGEVRVEESGVGPSFLRLDCPPGTLPRLDHRSLSRFSCVGCPKDHYLPPNGTRCLQCARGQFTEGDNAAACTACPPSGWDTAASTDNQRSVRCGP